MTGGLGEGVGKLGKGDLVGGLGSTVGGVGKGVSGLGSGIWGGISGGNKKKQNTEDVKAEAEGAGEDAAEETQQKGSGFF